MAEEGLTLKETLLAPGDEGMLDILWHSNAPWAGTGYGMQSALTAPLIAEELRCRLAFSAFYGLRGSRLGWMSASGAGYVVYPSGDIPYGNDVLGAHAKHWFEGRGGLVVTLTDPWVLNSNIIRQLPVLAWVPIDHDPIIPETLRWFKESGAVPLAMAEFGKRVMEEAGLRPLYAPHGYDATTFFPTDRVEARRQIGLQEDAFVVSMVAANKGAPGRKNFGAAIAAYARLAKHAGPGKTLLYLHTRFEDPEGEDIPNLCKIEGVTPVVPDQYRLALGMPTSQVATTLNASDVLLNPAWGEGFGLTVLEANACGTPAIVTDFSAMPEVAPASAGNWNVPGDKIYTQFGSHQVRADEDSLVDALVEAYEEDEDARTIRRAQVAENAERYEARKVVKEYWKGALAEALHAIQFRDQMMMEVG